MRKHMYPDDKQQLDQNSGPGMKTIPENLWRMRVVSINEFEFCAAPKDISLSCGDFVIANTRYGNDLARILGPITSIENASMTPIRRIERLANDQDFSRREKLAVEEENAYEICQERIDRFGLPMKLIEAHFVLNEQRLVFFFNAENRIDFRELVQELANFYKMRIELRQIGIRDSSRVIGGLAVCGRICCCHGVTDRLEPVTIKMAKEQHLSLNSHKISGACGRLLCCLAFEKDNYDEDSRKSPS